MSIANTYELPENGKKIMSRIALKIDTWENWKKDAAKSLVLHAGEVAFVQMGTVPPIGANNGTSEVLFKVGDGINEFQNLPWGSAKAADVYGWAKQDASTFAAWLAGGDGESDVVKLTDPFILKSVYDQAITSINGTISEISADVTELSEKVAGLEGLVGEDTNFATKDYVTNAVSNAKTELIGTEAGTATTIKGASAQAAEAKTAADNAQTAANNAQDDVDAANEWIENHGTVKHITENEMNTAISNADDAVKAFLIGTGTSNINTIKGAADAAAAAQSTAGEAKAKVETLIGNDVNKSARDIAAEELAAKLIPTNAQESLDTLNEIANWIQAHPGDAATMNSAIENIRKQLMGLGTEGTNGSAKKYVDDAIAAEVTARNTAISTALDPLDLTRINLTAGETLSFIKQENGTVTADKQSISITESQISDFGNYQPAGDYVDTTTYNNHVAEAVTENTYLVIDCGSSTVNID